MSHYPGFRKRMALNVFKKYVDVQAKLHDLRYLFWECTLRCNAACRHCGSDCSRDSSTPDMPAEDFLNIARQIKDVMNPNNVMVVVTGGEPLVRDDLDATGLELYKMGFPWGFVTNGHLLTETRMKSLMNAGLHSVTVSLDGLQESHNWIRGVKNSFDMSVNAISLVTKQSQLTYDVVTCVNKKNYGELDEIYKLLVELGVKKWRLFTIIPIGRAAEEPLFHVSNEEFRGLMDFIVKVRKEKKIHASFSCEGYIGDYENEARDGFFFCPAGINIASVLADGAISACPNNDRSFVQGNIYTDNFPEVWENRFGVMRDRSWAKTGICADCKSFKWCRGNGLHLHRPGNDDPLRCHYALITN